MQVSSGIAYFGDKEYQGSLRDRICNAIESDITSIQIKCSDIVDFDDFDGYNGEITCYIDNVKWDDEYFSSLFVKLEKLHVLGLNDVVIPTMINVSEYKGMSHDEKLTLLKKISSYLVQICNVDIKIGLLNTCDGVFVGTVLIPLIVGLYPNLKDKIGYAVNISEESDGGIREIDFRSVKTVNITPPCENGNIVYDRSRALIGNTYSEFIKFGYVPKMFAVADKIGLPIVNNLSSLLSNIVNLVISKVGGVSNGNGKGRGKVMPGYHESGVSDNAGMIENTSMGFVDTLQMFLLLTVFALIGVTIAVVLVLL